MKKLPAILLFGSMLVMASMMVFSTGCEDKPDTNVPGVNSTSPYQDPRETRQNDLYLYPSAAPISSVGETITFEVRGGDGPFSWSLTNPNAGTLTVTDYDRVGVYTVVAVLNNSVVIRAKDGRQMSSQIYIAGSDQPLAISPTTVDASDAVGLQLNFAGSGGQLPYTWVNAAPGLGTLVTSGDTKTASFTSTGSLVGAGTNTFAQNAITVLDSAGNVAAADVTLQGTP